MSFNVKKYHILPRFELQPHRRRSKFTSSTSEATGPSSPMGSGRPLNLFNPPGIKRTTPRAIFQSRLHLENLKTGILPKEEPDSVSHRNS